MTMSDEFERTWKEEVVAYSKFTSWDLCERTEEDHKKPE
jgi:hypothetical protein